MSKLYVLRYNNSSISWFKFTVKGDKVKIHGTGSASQYTDEEVPIEEARARWRELVREGWHQEDPKKAPRDWWFWN